MSEGPDRREDQDAPDEQPRDPLAPSAMPPRWQAGQAAPPPPPEFRKATGSPTMNLLKGLGIACVSCIAGLAGLVGACFAIVMPGDRGVYPVIFGAAVVFLAAATALFFLIRPRS